MKEFIDAVCTVFQKLSDFIWEFPTNLDLYANLPILGNLPFVIILLLAAGVYFTWKLRFVQVRYFSRGIKLITRGKTAKNGITPLAAFLLSTAMRVGPGNILGVTGAVATGGPGALFWMWMSAFFGMSIAFVESTLSQIYKKRLGDEYIGGLPSYGRKLLGGAAFAGVSLSLLYIMYAILSTPSQGFNTLSAMIAVFHKAANAGPAAETEATWLFFLIIMGVSAFAAFGGLRRITRITDVLVPMMAFIYILAALIIIAMNLDLVPWFFYAVFTEAFQPAPVFGGVLGIAVSQGIKRGLMSNEAGQGTLSMPAAVSDAEHPCDQGCLQAIGVFLDTIVICTMTGFIVIMGRPWLKEGASSWFELSHLDKCVAASKELITSGLGSDMAAYIIIASLGAFAFTCILGYLSFAEVCAKQITVNKSFHLTVRLCCLAVLAFGMAAHITGFDLSALWNISDLANILMVCVNLPLLFLGFKKVETAFAHYESGKGRFNSEAFGEPVPAWDEKSAEIQAAAQAE
ncbi:sodium:alanine symporter family protein [bacterium]|nr:sodium:alanine symporter family protein [bacterium]